MTWEKIGYLKIGKYRLGELWKTFWHVAASVVSLLSLAAIVFADGPLAWVGVYAAAGVALLGPAVTYAKNNWTLVEGSHKADLRADVDKSSAVAAEPAPAVPVVPGAPEFGSPALPE